MKKLCFYVIILGVVCWFAGFLAFNYNINNYKIDNKTKTDAIVALTGGKNRIAEAAQMMDKGLAKKMFISGVQKDTSLKEISRIQKVNMPPKGKIEMEDKSTNTVENAIETNEWIKYYESAGFLCLKIDYYDKNKRKKIIDDELEDEFDFAKASSIYQLSVL